MLERIVNHPTGRFSRCRACGAEPRHVRTSGRSSREPVQFLAAGCRHTLECRCGARTSRHDTLTAAESEWGTDYAQLALPLRAGRKSRRAA